MQAPTALCPWQPKSYQCFNKRNVSNSRHKLGRNQEYQFLSSSAVFVRLLDRMLRVPPVVDQFEIKAPAEQWLGRGVTEVVTDVTASLLSSDVEGSAKPDTGAVMSSRAPASFVMGEAMDRCKSRRESIRTRSSPDN